LAAKPTDTSKQYGQGKTTAAQIANSRGAPAGTPLTGPGNSQPHKVAVRPHKKNRSGGVDVHAVKSYKTAACATQQSAQVTIGQTQSTTIQAGVAGSAAVTTTAAATAQTTAGAAAGVQATIARPGKGHGAGGVLGAVTRLGVAGTRSTLPFTGFPLWMTVLIALGLISGGLVVRVRTGVAS